MIESVENIESDGGFNRIAKALSDGSAELSIIRNEEYEAFRLALEAIAKALRPDLVVEIREFGHVTMVDAVSSDIRISNAAGEVHFEGIIQLDKLPFHLDRQAYLAAKLSSFIGKIISIG